MLRRRSRTIPDDEDQSPDPHEEARASTLARPAIEHHTPPPGADLDLDLTSIDAPRASWAEPHIVERRSAPLTAAPAPQWARLDDEEDEELVDDEEEWEPEDEWEPEPAPASAPVVHEARRTPLRAAPSRQDAISSDIQSIVSDTVTRMLSNAMVELEVEPGTLQELRDQGALHQLTAAVARIEQQTALVDGLARQVAALTTAVTELSDSTRALLRHEWDNMPPPNFYVRVQRADDEVRRALEELSGEVRSRMPRSPRSS